MRDSREDAKARSAEWDVEEISAIVVDRTYQLHVEVGPGLLKTVSEVVLAWMLDQRGFGVRRIVNQRQNLTSSRLCMNQTGGAA